MALPDVSFTNNVGTVTFKRCLLDIADEWQWDGRAVVHKKVVSIQGWMTRDPSEAIEGVLTDPTSSTKSLGQYGNLVLPWTTLENIRIDTLEQGVAGWQVMAPVTASFVDDHPQSNIYTVSFFGLQLNNPRLTIPIPAKRTVDFYTQIPFVSIGDVTPDNPFYGPIRFRTGYDVMSIVLTGSIALDDGILPADIVETLQQRTGVTVGAVSQAELPDGYPVVFRLSDAIPELKKNLAISGVFVRQAQFTWNVEEQIAQVSIAMVTQPQAWAEQ